MMKHLTLVKRYLNIISLSTAAILIAGCDETFESFPAATFKEPQPQNKKAQNQFSGNITGKYLSLADSSVINIQSNYITRVYDYWTVIKDSAEDKQIEYVGDTKNVSKKYYPIKGKDSVKVHFYSNDTIFFINDNHVVKNFKGSYFLNTQMDDTTWNVKQLSLKKDTLTLGAVIYQNDINKLGQATSTNIDTTQLQNFNPSKKEFKTFIKDEGFSALEVFRKLK